MTDNFDDELSGIFDHLNPDDFKFDTSAFRDLEVTTPVGEEAFEDFVDEQIELLRHAFAAADGQVNSLAILSSPTRRRSFVPQDDETLGQYLTRLTHEAESMKATWLFLSRVAEVATLDAGEGADVRAYPNDDLPELEPGMLWFAMRREGRRREHRQGYLTIVGNMLDELIEGNPEQSFNVFEAILDAVHDG